MDGRAIEGGELALITVDLPAVAPPSSCAAAAAAAAVSALSQLVNKARWHVAADASRRVHRDRCPIPHANQATGAGILMRSRRGEEVHAAPGVATGDGRRLAKEACCSDV